jgi:hypothetical protein
VEINNAVIRILRSIIKVLSKREQGKAKMKTKNNFQNVSGELKCIWMESGLVKYKLCDKELDCENCEFDKVFRNLSTKMSDKNNSDVQNKDLVERLIKRIENENYDDKVLYLKNQLVLKNLFGNAYYIGINPIVLYLLDDFNHIHDFNNNEIRRDQIIFTLEGKWGIKQFISPINFMIIEKINLSQFKLNQWYAVILFNESDFQNFRISQEEWNKEKINTLAILKEFVTSKPSIGKSMMDGGEKIKYLHQYVGNKEYLKLLKLVFP